MVELEQGARLQHEALGQDLVVERHRLIATGFCGGAVGAAIHLPHAAARDEALDDEPTVYHVPFVQTRGASYPRRRDRGPGGRDCPPCDSLRQLPGRPGARDTPRARRSPKRPAIQLAILSTLALVVAVAAPARADTVADLVARNARAHGGDAALAAVKTLRRTGKLEFGGGGFHVEVEFGLAQKRPGEVRIEATIQGLTQVQAYDGHEGWQVQPFQGRHIPSGCRPTTPRTWSSRPTSIRR